jgi:hypothetical protein
MMGNNDSSIEKRSMFEFSKEINDVIKMHSNGLEPIIDESKHFCVYLTFVDNIDFDVKIGNNKKFELFYDCRDDTKPYMYIGSGTVNYIKNHNYKGSVKSEQYVGLWESMIKKHPELFKTYIISYHDDRQEALDVERDIHENYQIMHHPLFLNKSHASGIFGLSHSYSKGKKQTLEHKLKQQHSKRGKSYGDNEKRSKTLKGKMAKDKSYAAKIFKVVSPNNEIFMVHGEIDPFCKEQNVSIKILLQFLNKGRIKIFPEPKSILIKNTIGWAARQLLPDYDKSEETSINEYDDNGIEEEFFIPYEKEWYYRKGKSKHGCKCIEFNATTNIYRVQFIISYRTFYVGQFKTLDEAKFAKDNFLNELYEKYPVKVKKKHHELSKYPHVYYTQRINKFTSLHHENGKRTTIGNYYTPEEAYIAYCEHNNIEPELLPSDYVKPDRSIPEYIKPIQKYNFIQCVENRYFHRYGIRFRTRNRTSTKLGDFNTIADAHIAMIEYKIKNNMLPKDFIIPEIPEKYKMKHPDYGIKNVGNDHFQAVYFIDDGDEYINLGIFKTLPVAHKALNDYKKAIGVLTDDFVEHDVDNYVTNRIE